MRDIVSPLDGIVSPFGARRGFSDLSFFAGGALGLLYKPPPDVLFQDAAGTTVVAAAADPVGLILDRSRSSIGSNGAKRVNMLTYTEDLTNAAWGVSAVTISVPTKVAVDEVSFPAVTAAGDVSVVRQSFASLATTYLGTVEVKAKAAGDVGKKIGIYFNDSSIVNFTIHTLTADWTSISVTETTSATATCYFTIGVLGSTYGGGNQGACSVNIRKADARENVVVLPAYQRVDATWPATMLGNHAALSGANTFRPIYQVTPQRLVFDGSDDRLLTTLNPTTSGTIAMRLRGTTASKVALGSQGASNGRAFLALASDGSLAAGVGADSTTTIKGSADIRNAWATGIVTWDGSTVKLYQDGTQVYSGAQNGAVNTTVPWMLGCLNNNATAASFWGGDIGAAEVIDRAMTPAEVTSLTTLWSTIQ